MENRDGTHFRFLAIPGEKDFIPKPAGDTRLAKTFQDPMKIFTDALSEVYSAYEKGEWQIEFDDSYVEDLTKFALAR